MENRLGRTVRVFLVVLAAAGLYRLVAVPLVERRPRGAAMGRELSPEAAAAVKARAARRNAPLAALFPPDAWELKDPIVLESRQMRLLFENYHKMSESPDERRVQLVPCTLVMLPEAPAEGEAPVGRTLVMLAPQGAVLEFDEPFDLGQQELPKRLVGGSLRGQVTIRGTPSAPGAADDFEIVTRDVELEEMEVRTPEAVQFRYGRSSGSGRAMVARLLPGPSASDKAPNIGGVDTIRLDRNVRLRIDGVGGGIVPGGAAAAPGAEVPPVHVSCRGNLCLNVAANMITLEDHVDVVRTLPGGGTDQIACDLLAVLLRRDEKAGAATGGLEPVEIQAKGRPVVARSASAGIEARAQRLGYEIATRRVVLDGDEPVSLLHRGSEMEARSIDAAPGADGSPGTVMATGPGWLKSATPGVPPLMARWQKWLRIRPDGAEHVASLVGEADVQVEGSGRLKAGEMHLWFTAQRAGQAAPAAAAASFTPSLGAIQPARLLARSMVEVDVEQLTARTDKLELWFRRDEQAPPAPAAAAPLAPLPAAAPPAVAGGAQPTPPPGTPPGSPRPGGTAASPPAPFAAVAPPPFAGAAPARPAPRREPRTGRFVVGAGLVRGLVDLTAGAPQIDEMSLEGQVRVVEEPDAAALAAGRAPDDVIEIEGDQLQISRALRFDARAIVNGKPATVSGRGVDLQGPVIEVDRGRNRLSVEGAGRLGFPLSGGMPGVESLLPAGPAAPRPAAADEPPGRVEVGWQRRMDFDGSIARFSERVVATSAGAALRAGVLDVFFSRPVDFSADPSARRPAGERPEVARVVGRGKVRVEYENAVPGGEQSVFKLFVEDLQADVASGDVLGTGPGQLSMVRFGAPVGFEFVSPGAPRPAAPARADELTYYGVDFQRGLRGNYRRRAAEFHQRVEAICGPVEGWNQRLDVHAAGGLPPRTIALTGDVLGCGVAPAAPGRRRDSVEASAFGNVMVEADTFNGRSARLSWSEAKDMVVFEGDGRTDAQLFLQEQVGAPTSNASAGRIVFWPGERRVEVNDARYLDLDQLNGGATPKLPGLAPPARPAPAVAAPPGLPGAPPGLPGT
ncbi:MAG: hypothetical protein ACKO3G_02435 [Planctomycetaceae bacterium]